MLDSFSTARFEWVSRWALAGALILGVLAGVLIPRLTARAQEMEPQTYTVIAGGSGPYNADVLAFAPQSIQVHRGDTVTWLLAGFHNIHFEKGPSELVVAPEFDGKPLPQINPAILFPNAQSGSTFTGGDANSGIALDPTDPMASFSLVMDVEPGQYDYFCDIHPGMAGIINVVDSATEIPSPAEALTAGAGELAGNVNRGVQTALETALQPPTINDDGSVQVSMGVQAGLSAIQGFFPSVTMIEAGQSVTWHMPDNSMEGHSITSPFVPPGSEMQVIPQEGGPPVVALSDYAFPSLDSGATVGPGDSFNSGILFPGQSFTLTFSEPGVYPYVCMLHPGMNGTVVVMPLE